MFTNYMLYCSLTKDCTQFVVRLNLGTEKDKSQFNKSIYLEKLYYKPRCKRRCLNGGVCFKNGENRCRCPPGFRGRFCHKGNVQILRIIYKMYKDGMLLKL